MKKIVIACLSILSLALISCNQQPGFGALSFHRIHIQIPGSTPVHLKVESWRNDDGGIEVKTENYGSILIGDGSYLCYDVDECPICGEVEYK